MLSGQSEVELKPFKLRVYRIIVFIQFISESQRVILRSLFHQFQELAGCIGCETRIKDMNFKSKLNILKEKN